MSGLIINMIDDLKLEILKVLAKSIYLNYKYHPTLRTVYAINKDHDFMTYMIHRYRNVYHEDDYKIEISRLIDVRTYLASKEKNVEKLMEAWYLENEREIKKLDKNLVWVAIREQLDEYG